MYLFYFDECGTRDPNPRIQKRGDVTVSDHIYVLTAVSLFERYWPAFDQELSDMKLKLRSKLYREKKVELATLADCEVKSTNLRVPKEAGQKGYSPFMHNLDPAERTMITELFLSQIEKHTMRIFSVIVDKRKLRDHMDHEKLHKKAYELVLERIEHYLWEYHRKHSGIIVMDDTQKQLNHSVAMKHAFFQREGNKNVRFKHILEYPFFTDSRLSNGVQLADLCSYNIYRAFRNEEFDYPYFQRLLPHFYRSDRTREAKFDGLKVFPDDSDLIQFAQEGIDRFRQAEMTKPTEGGGLS